jgi:hypothetical protein
VGQKTEEKPGGLMAIFDGRDEDTLLKAMRSLEEEAFLKHLNFYPYLLENEEVKERLRAISEDWEKRLEKKSVKSSLRYTLYLIHLCPRLLEQPEFRWLKDRFYGILMMRLWSSEHDKSYWKALKRVRDDFTPGRPRTPEKKFFVARNFESHRNLWIKKEISRICKELLEIYNDHGREEDMKWAQLLRRVKIPRNIAQRELERLDRICNEEIKVEGDYSILSYLIENDLAQIGDEKERTEATNFWLRIWKPISKSANQLKSRFIEDVAKEMGLSRETIRKLLKEEGRQSIDLKI